MLGRLDEVSVDFEGEGSKIAVVDTVALDDLLADVLSERFDDQMELRLGVKWLHALTSPGLGGLMLPRIILRMCDNPKSQRAYQL